jgi:hypothetical protein
MTTQKTLQKAQKDKAARSAARKLERADAAAFKRGVEAAAGVMEGGAFNATTTHPYRLGDVILCKLNQTTRKMPRKNRRHIEHPRDAWLAGYAVALAEVCRLSRNDSVVTEAAKAAGLTMAKAKRAKVAEFDLKDLRKAGLR